MTAQTNDNPEKWSGYVLMLKEQMRQRENATAAERAECKRLWDLAICAGILRERARTMGVSPFLQWRLAMVAKKRIDECHSAKARLGVPS